VNIQIVMDHSGDSRHSFDPSSFDSVRQAQQRFDELTAKGFRAVALGTSERPSALQERFDPDVHETLFIPQLQGG
jgi:hypothetical protein